MVMMTQNNSVPTVKIKSIRFQNFKAFEDNSFDFTQDLGCKKFVCFHGPNGCGKCFAPETEILMYDGTIKRIKDIIVGDYVMGEDSKPKKVIETHIGNGKMYKIIPSKGDPYIVNGEHQLVLKRTGNIKDFSDMCDNDGVITISVNDFLNRSNWFKHIVVGFRTGVMFEEKPVKIDPYFLGLWLGDGSSCGPEITTADKEIKDSLLAECSKRGLILTPKSKKELNAPTYCLSGKQGRTNSLTNDLRYYNLINNKHIPFDYKINSRKNRLLILAGILDTDSSCSGRVAGAFDYISKVKQLAEDVVFISRSLGFQANMRECRKKSQNGTEGIYYRVSIIGDCIDIPTILPHKRSPKRIINKNCLHVGIDIEELGYGDYCGFQIEGNGRFLLSDFTVVHNSTILDAITIIFSKFEGRKIDHLVALLGKSVRHVDGIRRAIYDKDSDFLITADIECSLGDYQVQINKSGFIKDHPQEIKDIIHEICFYAKFDQELHQFNLVRSKWNVFKELFEAVTGFEVEETTTLFSEGVSDAQQNAMRDYVVGFMIQKPDEKISHKECSAGERKIIKSFSTLLNKA